MCASKSGGSRSISAAGCPSHHPTVGVLALSPQRRGRSCEILQPEGAASPLVMGDTADLVAKVFHLRNTGKAHRRDAETRRDFCEDNHESEVSCVLIKDQGAASLRSRAR